MAKIVAIHGIAQQGKGPNWLHDEWYKALLDGLRYSGTTVSSEDLICPAYSDLFRRQTLSFSDEDIDESELTPGDLELVDLIWAEAARVNPEDVIPPSAQTLGVHHRIGHRAFQALSHSRCITNLVMKGAPFFYRSLKQVTAYMSDPDVRRKAQGIVAEALTADTRVVVAHSLGSVVAYEVLCAPPKRNIRAFLTLGSPLGIRNVIFDRLNPAPIAGVGCWPHSVGRWFNFADDNDIVALDKKLSRLFGGRVEDIPVDNDLDAHEAKFYLTDRRTGDAITWGLQCE